MNRNTSSALPAPSVSSPIPVARAGDYMQLADTARQALELVELAAAHLEKREGSKHPLVVRLRSQAMRLLRVTP